ncbi:ergothioneine biosynthesis PLP-dependent enzyme EgtE [Mycobacterium sp. ACS4331]|uniref:ergothioneine biosynthesis PLP-dependent enzyme EgtE n=1 Tax=Mycobacterium sp. ACS4331 TaxID=1834121 RepID=UPI000800B7BD|nr:ergothioneine biosynthesis PLP-dependent enzyme EgtE [Mycobacterium sp. ACS4331]OBF14097.1 ergothioneine biosynthesis PLP-dependent enzyme EgtE [Mycobacterium sp. ACS4331]
MIADAVLAEKWRAARPPMAGVHVDSAACSRQSFAVLDATARHARHEAELGGYVAAQAAAPTLDAGRAAIATLTGLASADVAFTTGAQHSLDLLLGAWAGQRSLVCVPGEFGPNLAVMAAHGFDVQALPVDDDGRVRLDDLASFLRATRPGLVHLTGVPSHRGIAQPLRDIAQLCDDVGVPMVLDAAQALGQVDCAVGASAVYSTSRKWLAGPRGVGFVAVRSDFGERLARRVPPADWGMPLSVLQSFENVEANIAARLGFSVALGEHLAAGPESVRTALATVGRATRQRLDAVAGWRVVEAPDEPTAITTLTPPDGADPVAVRTALIADYGVVTTAAETARAPFELTTPVLRVAPHIDVSAEDLDHVAEALLRVTARQSA